MDKLWNFLYSVCETIYALILFVFVPIIFVGIALGIPFVFLLGLKQVVNELFYR